jgi:hypothetical protein
MENLRRDSDSRGETEKHNIVIDPVANSPGVHIEAVGGSSEAW